MASGSSCLFYLFQLFNLALILCSVGELISGIFVLKQCDYMDWSTLCFPVIGGFCLLLSLIGLATRHSDNVLFFYIALLLIAAAAEAGFALASLFLADYQKYMDTRWANLFRFGMLGVSAVQLFSAVFGWFYRESLCDAIHSEEPEPLVNSPKPTEGHAHYQQVKSNYY